jgi:phage gp36-like protein
LQAMAYATQDNLVPLRMTESDLIELTDDDNTGAVNTTIVDAALEEASGKVDSYCRNRYVTPLQSSDDVVALTTDIAVYLLFSRRRDARPNEIVRQRFEDAMKFLSDIATKKASIDQPATQPTAQSSLSGPEISDRDSCLTFRECNIEGFV